jgi:hypothetical protein
MSWLYLWPLGVLAAMGVAILLAILTGVNLILGLLVFSLYGLFPKDVLFDSVASRLRNRRVEENIQETFQMECPPDLPSSCLFVWQPHGLISLSSVFYNIGVCKHPHYKSNHAVTLPIYHFIPVVSDIARYLDIIPSDSYTIKKTLEKGDSVSVMLGGVREMLTADDSKHMKLYIRKRTGIFRIALETKKPLVPVLSFGENEIFPRSEQWWATWINSTLHSYMGLGVAIPTWKALQNWFELSYKPLKPIVTHVGSPIPATGDIDSLRNDYIKAVEDLFKKTAPEGYTLEIV